MKVYFISGLGADSRVFHHIQLPQGFEAVFLDWIKPLANESLHSYALRLAENIDRNNPFILVGLSMGGMMASEIAKEHKPVLTILISSISCSGHLPGYYRRAGRLGLHRVIPVSLFKYGSFIKRFFTAESKADKLLIMRIIRETDPAFIRWAFSAILQWNCENFDGEYIHIHGSRDEILPMRYTKPTHVISKGGHLMVLTQAKEINDIVAAALQRI